MDGRAGRRENGLEGVDAGKVRSQVYVCAAREVWTQGSRVPDDEGGVSRSGEGRACRCGHVAAAATAAMMQWETW